MTPSRENSYDKVQRDIQTRRRSSGITRYRPCNLPALWELQAFLRTNASSFVNYGERYRRGQRISTAVVESMVNRVIGRRLAKKQQMRWSRRGAHLLVQIRVAVLEGRLQDVFRRWYPRFQVPVGREATPA